MKKCYRFDSILHPNGILDNIIDAVYVLLLEHSHRTKSVYTQLNILPLCKHIHIQINKGYKHCDKNLKVNDTLYDVTHALFNIFKDAKQKKYKNILILEDDFMFDDRILNKSILQDLDYFINKEPFDIYYLGCIPILLKSNIKYYKHLPLIFGFCIHSAIYTKEARHKIMKAYKDTTIFDGKFIEGNLNKICDKLYCYYKPLCYQIFEETEQSKKWMLGPLKSFIKKNKLDKKPQPGFDTIYFYIYIFHIIILFIIIFLLGMTFRCQKKLY